MTTNMMLLPKVDTTVLSTPRRTHYHLSNLLSPLVLVLTVVISTSCHAQLCHDSTSFRFPLEVVPRSQDCAWILKNRDVEVQNKRKDRYCPLTHVKYACPLSCDACESSCEDNPHYLFQNENGETKNCAWIEKEDVELRRMLYCYAPRGSSVGNSTHGIISATASEIGENCVSSCGFCKGGFGVAPSEVAWQQLGMDIVGRDYNDEVGLSTTLSKDGNVVAVGFRDAIDSNVYFRLFYKCQNGKWCQIGDDIQGYFGSYYTGTKPNSLSNDGKTFAIQTSDNTTRVYHWDGHSWEQRGVDFSFDGLGIVTYSMSGDGKVLAFATKQRNRNISNSLHMVVLIYRWDDSSCSWKEFKIFLVGVSTGTNAATDNALSSFGLNLSDDGSVIAILSDQKEEEGSNTTFVHVYEWTGFSWCQKGDHIMLKRDSVFMNHVTNVVLSGDGNIVAIGPEITFKEEGNESLIRVYEWDGALWNIRGLNIDGKEALGSDDLYSIVTMTLSADGKALAAGLIVYAQSTFVVVVYHWDGSSWNPMGKNIVNDASFDILNSVYSIGSNHDGTKVALAVAGGPFDFAKVYNAVRGAQELQIL